jgi:hypothetical protein
MSPAEFWTVNGMPVFVNLDGTLVHAETLDEILKAPYCLVRVGEVLVALPGPFYDHLGNSFGRMRIEVGKPTHLGGLVIWRSSGHAGIPGEAVIIPNEDIADSVVGDGTVRIRYVLAAFGKEFHSPSYTVTPMQWGPRDEPEAGATPDSDTIKEPVRIPETLGTVIRATWKDRALQDSILIRDKEGWVDALGNLEILPPVAHQIDHYSIVALSEEDRLDDFVSKLKWKVRAQVDKRPNWYTKGTAGAIVAMAEKLAAEFNGR